MGLKVLVNVALKKNDDKKSVSNIFCTCVVNSITYWICNYLKIINMYKKEKKKKSEILLPGNIQQRRHEVGSFERLPINRCQGRRSRDAKMVHSLKM